MAGLVTTAASLDLGLLISTSGALPPRVFPQEGNPSEFGYIMFEIGKIGVHCNLLFNN